MSDGTKCTTGDLENRINKLEIESGVLNTSLNKDIKSLRKHMKLRFRANDKAITKAEESQKRYDSTHNDLIRKIEGMVSATEFKAVASSLEEKIIATKADGERDLDRVRLDVQGLRESRSESGGRDALDDIRREIKDLGTSRDKSAGMSVAWVIFIAALGAATGIVSLLVRLK